MVPSVLKRTVPEICITYSFLIVSIVLCTSGELFGSETIWIIPDLSLRSINITPPWSLIEEHHPEIVIELPSKVSSKVAQ